MHAYLTRHLWGPICNDTQRTALVIQLQPIYQMMKKNRDQIMYNKTMYAMLNFLTRLCLQRKMKKPVQ